MAPPKSTKATKTPRSGPGKTAARKSSSSRKESTRQTASEDAYVDEGALASHCRLPIVPPPTFGPGFDPGRAAAILVSNKKWVNGTQLRYCFLGQPQAAADRQVVVDAFATWKGLPIGLELIEVDSANEAELRISFDRSESSSWSLVGRDALGASATEATMNFGWQLSGWSYGRDTALHEIGHALGLPHEHQNPAAGIVWNEPAVLAHFAGPPNSWDEADIRWNILRKIPPDTVQGSTWDPDSVMHYQFEAGLIDLPVQYRNQPLIPAGGLSARDVEWVKTFYPAGPDEGLPALVPFQSQSFDLSPGQQVDFLVEPPDTRQYTFGTFGTSDTVLVLFEKVDDGPEALQGLRYRGGDDDSGTDLNARVGAKLFKGRTYVLRMRLYWAGGTGRTAVMMW